jgi:hypothetical protein
MIDDRSRQKIVLPNYFCIAKNNENAPSVTIYYQTFVERIVSETFADW